MGRNLHLPDAHRRVMDALKHCKKESEAVSNKELAEIVGIGVRRCRKIVKELVEVHYQPIGTAYGCDGGHYWMTTAVQRAATAEALSGHAISIFKRISVLNEKFARKLLGQMELELK